MASFNQVILMGNLTRDPQVKVLQNGGQVCEFGIAVNKKWKTAQGEEREDVLFIDCSAFGKTAELIGAHFSKGRPIMVVGRLKLDQWDDKQSGAKRSKHTVAVETFQFCGGQKEGQDQQEDQRPPAAPAPAHRQPQAAQPRQSQVYQQASQDLRNRVASQPAPEPPFPDKDVFKESDIPF